MNFIPYNDKIEIKPRKRESIILSEDKDLIEMGEVISIGKDVKFVKVGDTLFFDSWGVSKTPEIDGEFRYIVPEDSNVILGKYES